MLRNLGFIKLWIFGAGFDYGIFLPSLVYRKVCPLTEAKPLKGLLAAIFHH